MKWALLSVWDKTGIVELAQVLTGQKFSIMSSGGTGKVLADAGIKYTEVSSYTGFPEMMDGRVKTLHPKVHGGLLGRRQIDDSVMMKHGINRIDLLAVNLYPFEAMAGKKLCLEDLIEYIDVGGPAMIRAAAKNYKDVLVVVDPEDTRKYPKCSKLTPLRWKSDWIWPGKRLRGRLRTTALSAITSTVLTIRSRMY